MKTWIILLVLVAAASLVPLSTYGETPFNFPSNDALFITRIGDDYYMVVEDVGYNETQQFWAVWKFNGINGNWELYEFGEPTPGEKRASGDYAYFSSQGVLVTEIDFSTFLGCGWYTTTAAFSATFSEPTLTLVTMDTIPPQDTLELTRISGNPGEIVGEWSLELGSNTYRFTFNEVGGMTIAGNVQECNPPFPMPPASTND
jgi:hypothetical protein